MPEHTGFALVTGTSSGVGAALARALTDSGWRVLGIARRDVPTWEGYEHLRLDLADPRCVPLVEEQIAEPIAAFAGKPIGLVNNAAVPGQRRLASSYVPGDLAQVMALNLTTPMLLLGLFHRLCPDDSPLRVINVSSGLASMPMAGGMDYCTTKAGLVMASRVFAAELDGRAASGVLVYEPGIVDTEMQTALRESDPAEFPQLGMFHEMKRSGSLATAEAVVGPMIEFLQGRGEGLASARYGQ